MHPDRAPRPTNSSERRGDARAVRVAWRVNKSRKPDAAANNAILFFFTTYTLLLF